MELRFKKRDGRFFCFIAMNGTFYYIPHYKNTNGQTVPEKRNGSVVYEQCMSDGVMSGSRISINDLSDEEVKKTIKKYYKKMF